MKKVTGLVISLVFLTFMVKGAMAADVEMNGDAVITGSVNATSFSGSGSGLTNLDPTKITSGSANISISGNAATATTANSVAAGVINTQGLANFAVTPGKISFYGNVKVVAPSGGDYTNPAEAMAAAWTFFGDPGWCQSKSESNPCLLKIMPGQYDIGTSSVPMMSYIDIEGSGENVTIIQGAIDSNTSGVIRGASNSELRFLTVKNTGSNTNAVAIYNSNASPKLTNVTVTSSGATNNYGVYNYNSGAAFVFTSPTMTNMTINASGGAINYGVYNDGTDCSGLCSTSPTMTNTKFNVQTSSGTSYGVYNDGTAFPTMTNVNIFTMADTSYGVYNNGASATMTNMDISAYATEGGTAYGVYMPAAGGTFKINHSVIGGGTESVFVEGGNAFLAYTGISGGAASSGTGTVTCLGVYDTFNYNATTCP